MSSKVDRRDMRLTSAFASLASAEDKGNMENDFEFENNVTKI